MTTLNNFEIKLWIQRERIDIGLLGRLTSGCYCKWKEAQDTGTGVATGWGERDKRFRSSPMVTPLYSLPPNAEHCQNFLSSRVIWIGQLMYSSCPHNWFLQIAQTHSLFFFNLSLNCRWLHKPSFKWSLVTGRHQKCFPSLRPLGLDVVNSMDQVFVWSPVFLTGDRSVDHLVHFVWSAMWTK